MQIVTLSKFVDFDGIQVPAGVPQVWPDGFAQAFSHQLPQYVQAVKPLNGEYRAYSGQALHHKKLILWRTGGFGDLLFLTPLLAEVHRRWPSSKVTIACRPKYQGVFRNNPHVAEVVGLPVPLHLLNQHDYHLHFEGTIEKSTDPNLHAVDLFAQHAGLRLRSKRLVFQLTEAQRQRGRRSIKELNPEGRRVVAVQVRASSPVRTYPWPFLEQVVRGLTARGHVVLLMGGLGDSPGLRIPYVFDFCGVFPEMLDSVTLMAACDALVAPDSSLTHFAGALEVPTVALYGPFPGKVRTRYYERCVTLEPEYACKPCFVHGHLPCPEAQRAGQIHSPCFFHLPPERILDSVEQLLSQPRRLSRC